MRFPSERRYGRESVNGVFLNVRETLILVLWVGGPLILMPMTNCIGKGFFRDTT
jgi:hypothetical protein